MLTVRKFHINIAIAEGKQSEAHLSSGRSIILTDGTSDERNIRATSSSRLS